jgi:hypothetical protein
MAVPSPSDFVDEIPFAVYGLAGDFAGPRRLAAVGRHGETVELVALGHGEREDPDAPWVQVAVMGPLEGAPELPGAPGRWRIDPLPMVISELLDAAGAEFADGAELHRAVERLVATKPASRDVLVEGALTRFRVWDEQRAWAAVHDLAPNHMLYVIGRNTDPAEIELSRDVDIGQYVRPLAP